MTDPNLEPRLPGQRRSIVLTQMVIAALVSAAVSGLVTIVFNFAMVPSGIGWRKLVHEGTVTVPGGQPFTVHYPTSFSSKPSLSFEFAGNELRYFRIDESTPSHFTLTNTSVDKQTGNPIVMTLRWRAEGGSQ